MNDPRQQQLSEIFLTGSTKIAGIECRPFSLGTLTAARVLGLSRVIGQSEGPCQAWPMERQMAALLFIQSQPLPSVQEMVRLAKKDFDSFDARLLEFELGIPLTALAELSSQLQSDAAAVGEAQFEIEAKPGEKGETDSPKS